MQIAHSEVQMETGDEFLHFNLIKKSLAITRKITLKLVSLPSFGVVLLDCNHVEGFCFQKSENKLETSYGFGGRHL